MPWSARRQRPSECEDKIIDMLKRGVDTKCVILDPDCESAKTYVDDNKEPEYLERMKVSREQLIKIKRELHELGYNKFHILLYNAFPRFHASCIDNEHLLALCQFHTIFLRY